MTLDLRYTRQVRLAEVGREGQARLEATLAAVSCPAVGCARAVEATYLERAGVKVSTEPSREVVPPPEWLERLSPAAAEVAIGAHAALMTLRRALGIS